MVKNLIWGGNPPFPPLVPKYVRGSIPPPTWLIVEAWKAAPHTFESNMCMRGREGNGREQYNYLKLQSGMMSWQPHQFQNFLVSTPSPIHITHTHAWNTLFWLEVCTEMFRPWKHAETTSGNPNFHIDSGNPDNVSSRSGNPYSLFACIIHHLIFKFVTLSPLIRQ